jgi:hypothetical protein
MAGLLVVGFLCDLLVTAVNKRFHMQPETDAAPDAAPVVPANQSASA